MKIQIILFLKILVLTIDVVVAQEQLDGYQIFSRSFRKTIELYPEEFRNSKKMDIAIVSFKISETGSLDSLRFSDSTDHLFKNSFTDLISKLDIKALLSYLQQYAAANETIIIPFMFSPQSISGTVVTEDKMVKNLFNFYGRQLLNSHILCPVINVLR